MRGAARKGGPYRDRPGKLEVLNDMAAQVESANVPGIFLEADRYRVIHADRTLAAQRISV